jgi:hypothetical protein
MNPGKGTACEQDTLKSTARGSHNEQNCLRRPSVKQKVTFEKINKNLCIVSKQVVSTNLIFSYTINIQQQEYWAKHRPWRDTGITNGWIGFGTITHHTGTDQKEDLNHQANRNHTTFK